MTNAIKTTTTAESTERKAAGEREHQFQLTETELQEADEFVGKFVQEAYDVVEEAVFGEENPLLNIGTEKEKYIANKLNMVGEEILLSLSDICMRHTPCSMFMAKGLYTELRLKQTAS